MAAALAGRARRRRRAWIPCAIATALRSPASRARLVPARRAVVPIKLVIVGRGRGHGARRPRSPRAHTGHAWRWMESPARALGRRADLRPLPLAPRPDAELSVAVRRRGRPEPSTYAILLPLVIARSLAARRCRTASSSARALRGCATASAGGASGREEAPPAGGPGGLDGTSPASGPPLATGDPLRGVAVLGVRRPARGHGRACSSRATSRARAGRSGPRRPSRRPGVGAARAAGLGLPLLRPVGLPDRAAVRRGARAGPAAARARRATRATARCGCSRPPG